MLELGSSVGDGLSVSGQGLETHPHNRRLARRRLEVLNLNALVALPVPLACPEALVLLAAQPLLPPVEGRSSLDAGLLPWFRLDRGE